MKKKFNIMLCTLIGVLSACNEYPVPYWENHSIHREAVWQIFLFLYQSWICCMLSAKSPIPEELHGVC